MTKSFRTSTKECRRASATSGPKYPLQRPNQGNTGQPVCPCERRAFDSNSAATVLSLQIWLRDHHCSAQHLLNTTLSNVCRISDSARPLKRSLPVLQDLAPQTRLNINRAMKVSYQKTSLGLMRTAAIFGILPGRNRAAQTPEISCSP